MWGKFHLLPPVECNQNCTNFLQNSSLLYSNMQIFPALNVTQIVVTTKYTTCEINARTSCNNHSDIKKTTTTRYPMQQPFKLQPPVQSVPVTDIDDINQFNMIK
jgi:hypothetical protein